MVKRKKTKASSKFLGVPITRLNVLVTIAAGIAAIGGAIVVIPAAWSLVRPAMPAVIGYVDGKIEQSQVPVLRSLSDIQEAQAKRALSVIRDDMLKVEIDIVQQKDPAKKAAANLQKNKLLDDQAEQQEILKAIAKSRMK